MTRSARLTSASLALILALSAGSAMAQDATFDIEADDPAVEAELSETEAELAEFFEDTPTIELYDYDPTPDATAREESALLDRADREATEFNDIDDDDLARLGREDTVRLEKPGQLEKDFPVACPLGTESRADGSCAADPG